MRYYYLMKKIFLSIIIIGIFGVGCINNTVVQTQPPSLNNTSPAATSTSPSKPVSKPQLTEPISNALPRITKKTFGLYVTPKNSPVQPEKFTGFHTGVDFETTAQEQNTDVGVFATCDGKLLLKKYASGYGGVAVQSCALDGKGVTIIYGHLRLSSITPNIGDSLKSGQKIAVLGTGYSSETNGERKHLHFGIHIGATVNILGYIQKQSDLRGWLDPAHYLK